MAPHCLARMSSGKTSSLAEELDGTGGGDTGGADEQLAGLLKRFIRRNAALGLITGERDRFGTFAADTLLARQLLKNSASLSHPYCRSYSHRLGIILSCDSTWPATALCSLQAIGLR